MRKKSTMGFQIGGPVNVINKDPKDGKSGKLSITSSDGSRVELMEKVIESTGKRISIQESRRRMLKQLDLSFKRLA